MTHSDSFYAALHFMAVIVRLDLTDYSDVVTGDFFRLCWKYGYSIDDVAMLETVVKHGHL